MPSVYIKTYGCQMNERDSEAVAAQLIAKGYALASSEAGADVVLLNTCSVRDHAEDTRERYVLWLDTAAASWVRPDDFEKACSFAASLAEDLLRSGTLLAASVGDAPARPFRRVADLAIFLDDLARAVPLPSPPPAPHFDGSPTLLRFGPGPASSLLLYADNEPIGSA